MRILYITPNAPDDRHCGGGVRSGFLLRALQEVGEVTTIRGLPRALRFRMPWFLTIPFMRFPRIMDWLYLGRDELLQRMGLCGARFDCVVVRYVGPLNVNAAWKIAPCFVDVDDLPSQAAATGKWRRASRWVRGTAVWLLERWQEGLIRRCSGFWLCNAEQVSAMRKLAPCAYLPNIAEPPAEGYRVERVESRSLLTVGGMAHVPNREGVDWFVDFVWPRIKAKFPDAVYNVVGGGAVREFAEKWAQVSGVKVWGFVDSLTPCYENAGVVVVPIFSGAGTCIKVREAALHGRKVFSSPFGARGLTEDECRRLGVTVCASSDDFATEIVKYIGLPASEKIELQQSIAHAARAMVSYQAFAHSVVTLLTNGVVAR